MELIWQAGHLNEQGRRQEALEALVQAAERATTPGEQAWIEVKLAEVDLGRLLREPAIERLRGVIDHTADQAEAANPRNWARVRLAETLTYEHEFDEADQVCDAILAEHASGAAEDRQAEWALIWKARSRMFSNRLPALTEALEPARMGAALAVESGHPDLAYEAQYLLGEMYERLSKHAADLVKAGGDAFASSPIVPIVEQTRRDQNYVHPGESGPLMIAAMEHYGAAMVLAEQFEPEGDKAARARLHHAQCMRHLGMRDKAIATLRMGIKDPADLTYAERSLAQSISEFLQPYEADAWWDYLRDPQAGDDPTQAIVAQQFGKSPSQPCGTVNRPEETAIWTARYYESQKRYREALDHFARAASLATASRDRALAHSGMARCQLALERRSSDPDMRREWRAAAVESARKAAADWTARIGESTGGDSHEAIEQAIDTLWEAALYDEAVALAEALARPTGGDRAGDAQYVAFARMKLAEVRFGRGQWVQAADEARALWNLSSTSDDAAVQQACIQAMFIAHAAFVNRGDIESARWILDTLEQAQPDKLAGPIARRRALLATLQGDER